MDPSGAFVNQAGMIFFPLKMTIGVKASLAALSTQMIKVLAPFSTHSHLGCDSFLTNNFLNVWNGVYTCLIHIPQLICTNVKPVSCFSHLNEEVIYNPFGDRYYFGKGGLLRIFVLQFRESLVETFLPIPTQFGHVFIFVLMQVNNISMGKLWFWASDSQVANPSQPFSLQRER